jgi:hypothetical protein
LKLKGDLAYELLQERLVAGGTREDPAPDVGPPVS